MEYGYGNPQHYGGGGAAGFTPDQVVVVSGSTWNSYSTIAAAKGVAISYDTILVGPGTYDENNLLKNNVNYYFYPGAKVSYTGAAGNVNCGIFDNGAQGANTAVACTIGGYGEFTYAGGGTPTCGILNIGKAAQISVEGCLFSSTRGCVKVIDTAWTSVVHVNVKKISTTAGGVAGVMLTQGDSLYVEADLIENTAGTTIDISSDDPNSGNVYIHAKQIASTLGYAAIQTDNYGKLWVEVDGPIVATECPAIYFNSGPIRSHIKAQSIQTKGFFTTPAIRCVANADSTVDCPYITSNYTGEVVRFDSAGTLRLIDSRVVSTGTNGKAAYLVSGGRFETHGDCAFVSDSGATDSITGASGVNIYNYGSIRGNKALGLTGGGKVLGGSYVFDDSNVA